VTATNFINIRLRKSLTTEEPHQLTMTHIPKAFLLDARSSY